MTSHQLVNAGNDAAHNDEKVSPSTNIVHDTGAIVSESTMIQNSVDVTPKFFQTMPQNTLDDYLKRATEIATYSLGGESSLTLKASFDPWELFLANTRINDKVKTYLYIRGTIQVTFVFNFPGNAYGTYVVSAFPLGGTLSNPVNNSSFEVNSVQHVENCMQVDQWSRVDCANSENVVMQLPFLWPFDYATLPVGPKSSWIINLWTLQAVKTAIPGGNPTGSVRVFAEMVDYELAVPHLQGRDSGHSKHLTMTHSMKTLAPEVHKKLSGKVSGAADKVEKIAETVEKIPVIGAYAAPVAAAAKKISKVASWFGFTREEDEQVPMPISMRSVTNVAHIDGQDASDVAAFSATNSISIDPTLAGVAARDCLSCADFFNRWTLVDSFTWAVGAAAGSQLSQIPISPTFCRTGPHGGGEINARLTTAGYFGLPFQFWRGDMEYLVIIPASKTHRGTIQVLWLPTGSTATGSVTNATLNQIIDVSAGSDYQFSVGYAREKPFLENRLMLAGSLWNYDFCNGRLVFRVVNPLISQNTAASVECFVFARAKANMEFAVPKNDIWIPFDPSPQVQSIYTSIKLQGALGDEDDHEAETHVLVPDSGPYPMQELLFGEKVESIRALMQKPSRLFWDYISLPQTSEDISFVPTTFPFPTLGYIPFNLTDPSYFGAQFNWFGYFRPCFTGIACSERFKYIARNPGEVFGASPIYNSGIGENSLGWNWIAPTLMPVSCVGANMGHEVTVPYYTPRKYLLGRVQFPGMTEFYPVEYAGTTPDIRMTQLMIQNSQQVLADTNTFGSREFGIVYHSAGPDIRVTNFLQIPEVNLNHAVVLPNPQQAFYGEMVVNE